MAPDLMRGNRPGARSRAATVLAAALVALALAGAGSAWAAFAGKASSDDNELRAIPDWVAPSAQRSVVQKAEGGVAGYVREGGGFRVLAQVTDAGNPPSGVASVAARFAGLADIPLSAGSFTAEGIAYNQRSAVQSAPSGTPEGSYAYGLASSDSAGNSRVDQGFSVTVDNSTPRGTDVQTENRAGGTDGLPEPGDSISFSFSELIDPYSVVAGWSGAATTNVVVRVNDDVNAFGGDDTLVVHAAGNGAALPLGTVDLGDDRFVDSNSTFGASGSASTMRRAGTTITVTLGSFSGELGRRSRNRDMTWHPANGATDRAGNPMSTATVNESGGSDRDF